MGLDRAYSLLQLAGTNSNRRGRQDKRDQDKALKAEHPELTFSMVRAKARCSVMKRTSPQSQISRGFPALGPLLISLFFFSLAFLDRASLIAAMTEAWLQQSPVPLAFFDPKDIEVCACFKLAYTFFNL
jgi:hypothetical protein